MKKCNKCKIKKPLTEFSKDKTRNDNLCYRCKTCSSKAVNKWCENNKERKKAVDKIWKKNNPDKLHEAQRRDYLKGGKERRIKYSKQWRKDNPEKKAMQDKRSKLKHAGRIREYMKSYHKQYRKDNPHTYKWRSILRNTLACLNQQKSSSTITMMGYSAIELKKHLDSQGMDWNNDQVDHIIPVSWFKRDTPIHVVNDLRNLQPLSPLENQKKGNRFVINKNFSYINEVKHWVEEDKLNQL